jgi:phage recombination protein Bet
VNDIVIKDRAKLISTLQNSLYVGAKAESVEMVIAYCEAAGLDVMQKPAHIVPMNTKNPVTGSYEWRDVVMPGIGLYRIQADRSGTLAGASEPEFGPEITQDFTDKNGNIVTVKFPEWCKVSMKKMVSGQVVEFIAKEYWLENYATDSSKSTAPNAMWRKRPRGQLAKCSEAQALRKGWPEVGQSPTAEEMEGKVIDMGQAEVVREPEQIFLPAYSQEDFDKNFQAWAKAIQSGKRTPAEIIKMVNTKATLTDLQMELINNVEVE